MPHDLALRRLDPSPRESRSVRPPLREAYPHRDGDVLTCWVGSSHLLAAPSMRHVYVNPTSQSPAGSRPPSALTEGCTYAGPTGSENSVVLPRAAECHTVRASVRAFLPILARKDERVCASVDVRKYLTDRVTHIGRARPRHSHIHAQTARSFPRRRGRCSQSLKSSLHACCTAPAVAQAGFQTFTMQCGPSTRSASVGNIGTSHRSLESPRMDMRPSW